MRRRATAIILRDSKILLIRRVKPETEYYIFPGGGVDEGETTEDALVREVQEETSLQVVRSHHLFDLTPITVPSHVSIHKGPRTEHVFLIDSYSGIPVLGGPEKERAGPDNQYHLEWVPIADLLRKEIYPREVAERLVDTLA